ncbi:MAG: LPP20 family lipoprotein [Schwartzia sp.]|nr:LPP20 family lipoprotein [Schwartzia sp. (in: firmicutes)]
MLWENEVVYAVGHGRQPNINEQGADDLARQAAIMDAYRHLVGAVQGVQVDAESVMEMLMLKQDTVRNKIAGVVRGASIVDEGKLPNGSYYVKMVAPLYGVNSVAAAALPEVMPKQPVPPPAVTAPVITQVEIQEVKSVRYTGVIVDAGGLGLMPAMSPVIYDTNGRAVYGASNIDVNFAIGHGMVGYSKSVSDANSNSRIGTNALVVKAVSVKGGSNSTNPVNVVISPEDADRILLSNQDGGYLQKGAVLFVR